MNDNILNVDMWFSWNEEGQNISIDSYNALFKLYKIGRISKSPLFTLFFVSKECGVIIY